jgi:acylphosphatase
MGRIMLEMRLVVHGSVQGVGYRYSIIEYIEQHQLMVRGYIWNRPNGTVEILAQGDIETLKEVRRFAVTGSAKSVVRDIEEAISEIPDFTYDSFDIKY